MVYDEQARTNKVKNEHGQVTKVVCIIAPVECHSGYRYFQLKGKYSYDRCPSPVYFYAPMLIIYLSVIETFVCHREIELNRAYCHRFCTNY